MGTRADFYVGRGADAEWLGSIAYDGYPNDGYPGPQKGPGIRHAILFASTEQAFRDQIGQMFAACDHSTLPEQGWPWPWKDSHLSDYAYAFDGGKVYIHRSGWFAAGEEINPKINYSDLPECPICKHHAHPDVIFPDMAGRSNVTLGRRSGLLILGLEEKS